METCAQPGGPGLINQTLLMLKGLTAAPVIADPLSSEKETEAQRMGVTWPRNDGRGGPTLNTASLCLSWSPLL